MRFKTTHLGAASIALAVLTACGGGGGSGGGGAALPENANAVTGDANGQNYGTVAANAYNAFRGNGAIDSFVGVTEGSFSADSVERAQSAAVKTAALSLRRFVSTGFSGMERAQAYEELSEACPQGGTLRVGVNDADNNGEASPGDTVAATFTACSIDGDSFAGTATITVLALGESSERLRVSFANLTINDTTVNGTIEMSMSFSGSTTTLAMAYDGATISRPNVPMLTLGYDMNSSYNASTGIETARFDGGFGYGSETFWFRQDVVFSGSVSNALPTSGALSILDKDGDRVVIKAQPQGLIYEFYPAGATAPTATQSGPAS